MPVVEPISIRLRLDDGQDVPGRILEPGDRWAPVAHDAASILATVAAVPLERDAALGQPIDGGVDVADGKVQRGDVAGWWSSLG